MNPLLSILLALLAVLVLTRIAYAVGRQHGRVDHLRSQINRH